MPPVRRESAVERSDKSGQAVLELGKLHLHLAVAAVGPPREDVEDELGAVDDPHLGDVADGLDLGGGQVLVEDDEVGAELLGADDELLELSLTREGISD